MVQASEAFLIFSSDEGADAMAVDASETPLAVEEEGRGSRPGSPKTWTRAEEVQPRGQESCWQLGPPAIGGAQLERGRRPGATA